jgi:ATP-dependent Clp protease ATP-binding subunit ClpC
MFERFSDQARRAVVLARQEAGRLDHNYIGTEHLLAGLHRVEHGAAGRALASSGVSLAALRAEIEAVSGRGKQPPSGHIPFTPQAKKVIERSQREAVTLGHDFIGTGHLLLGALTVEDGAAVQILSRLGVRQEQLRARVIDEIAVQPEGEEGPALQPVWRVQPASAVLGLLDGIEERLDAIERRLGIVRPAAPGDAGEAGEPGAPGETGASGGPGNVVPPS